MDIDSGTSTGYGPTLRASAEYFRWPTTVALFSVLLVLALLTLPFSFSAFTIATGVLGLYIYRPQIL